MKQAANNIQAFLSSLLRRIVPRRAEEGPAEFRAVFEQFKEVLASNNHALETITDMGEKLGGEYLFDIVYVINAHGRLKSDMEASLLAFDGLTQRRYPSLRHVFGHIDGLISGALAEAPDGIIRPVLFLEDIPWGAEREVGGKIAHLAELRNQLHLRVPDAFVLTTAAFDAFMKSNGLDRYRAQIRQDSPPQNELLRELRERILTGTIPPAISSELQRALKRIVGPRGKAFLAVRSSAPDEDGAHSFAGQFRTVLNVPPDVKAVEQAYREVLASLYYEKAISYQTQTGYDIGAMKMAVGCMIMAEAAASGVLYSTAPDGERDIMTISAVWGLGEAVVEGRTEADLYVVRKAKAPLLISTVPGAKKSMIIADAEGGVKELDTPEGLRDKPCLTSEQAAALAGLAMTIERYFGVPQDMEWSLDAAGTFTILQARPLGVGTHDDNAASANGAVPSDDATSFYPVIIRDRGTVVQRGAGAGMVFIARTPEDIKAVPRGAILVAPNDSSLMVTAMTSVSAIITERGTVTSHMAALCRELKVPTIVNLTKATELLEQGQVITLVAGEDDRSMIYRGAFRELLAQAARDGQRMENVYEFRRKRYLLRYISPLHLVDPLMDEFTPERCRTLHDILRFMHEKSVAELVLRARGSGSRMSRQAAVVRLELPVPAGLVVMDLGGGLSRQGTERKVTFDQIASIPFKALVRGMIHPGAWQAEAVAMMAQDFISSMMRMPDITAATDSTAGYNVAVISRDYMNMSIRFGYHYNMIDCFCSENARNNHIYFRFAGGATDLTKRSRRLELIAKILKEYGFNIKIKGDLLIARLAGLDRAAMETVLDQTGRLIAYARQLDAALHDDRAIDRYAHAFLNGTYEL